MYHYTECGLPNVYLQNGYEERDTPYGKGIAIRNVDGLHRAIARDLVNKPGRLSGVEFRFLRKRLEMSQRRLGAYLGASEQAVARWEKGKTRVPKIADRFLRAFYREQADGNAAIRDLMDRLNDRDVVERKRHQFRQEGDDWKTAA